MDRDDDEDEDDIVGDGDKDQCDSGSSQGYMALRHVCDTPGCSCNYIDFYTIHSQKKSLGHDTAFCWSKSVRPALAGLASTVVVANIISQ
jgi:hypothetical protein